MVSSSNQDSPHNVKYNPYTPITSLARELGILFGFMGACLAAMGLYYVFWHAAQRRHAAKESARVEALVARNRAAEAEKQSRAANANALDSRGGKLSKGSAIDNDVVGGMMGVGDPRLIPDGIDGTRAVL